MATDLDFTQIANRKYFTDFLDKEFSHGTYMEKVLLMMEKKEQRFLVNINDLREFDQDLSRRFIRQPNDFLPDFEAALRDTIRQKEPNFFLENDYDIHIGVYGSLGSNHVTPRSLLSHYLGSLVCVEGIVTHCSIVLPKVVKTVHYCPKTNQFHEKLYRDATSMSGMPTGFTYPTKDENGNLLETEFGLSRYKDTQTLAIQEMPERAPAGQLPRSVEVILEDDLVDVVKPGDRIQVIGVYRALASKAQGASSGVMRTILVANNLILLGKQIQHPNISEQDIENIRKISKKKDVFSLLAASIAPSIYGHEHIKKALLLLMFGGVEKNFDNGTHIRGDINILMVGDPSTAKSQLLRFMLHIAPLAISTTGRASTGVGLTAAVTSDKDSGERTLQAGAMVLADRGIVCIDEFDKMSDLDRVAMHEVMEQQTVTIAKAGVHTSLNARCSVVAAANPIYGQYNREISIQRNVGLPDSLLSRFDLLFIVLDEKNPKRDREISEHVINIHRYIKPGEDEGGIAFGGHNAFDNDDGDDGQHGKDADDDEEQNGTAVYESNNVYATYKQTGNKKSKQKPLISVKFLRKYVFYAKNRITPVLKEEAVNLITEKYCDLRKNNNQKTLPITPRTLETLIRLATAHAKCRLSLEVTEDDVNAVFEIVDRAISFVNSHQQQYQKEQRQARTERETAPPSTGNTNAALRPVTRSQAPLGSGVKLHEATDLSTRKRKRNTDSEDSQSKAKGKGKAKESTEDNESSSSDIGEADYGSDYDFEGGLVTSTTPSTSASTTTRKRKLRKNQKSTTSTTEEDDQMNDVEDSVSTDNASEISPARLERVSSVVDTLTVHESAASIDDVLQAVNKNLPTGEPVYTAEELDTLLNRMQDKNQIMCDGGMIYRI